MKLLSSRKALLALVVIVTMTSCVSSWRRRIFRRRRCPTHSCSWHWGGCSTTCGPGIQSPRVTARQGNCGSCNLPSPRSCSVRCCKVGCIWGSWGSWSSCSKTCGSGNVQRSRSVSRSASCGGTRCYGPYTQTKPCNTQCCKVDCDWDDWGSWSSCSKTCGGGIAQRSRRVSRRASCGGTPCYGNYTQTESCNTLCCPIDCQWGSWENVMACTRTCGLGTQFRVREIAVPWSCNGKQCSTTKDDLFATVPCNEGCCPVDCEWNDWMSWGSCSKSCGEGTIKRFRSIKATPSCGGSNCTGLNFEEMSCNDRRCPDIDECSDGSSKCDTNANCTNTDGSYKCTCKSGYGGDGLTCENKNECSTDENNCHEFANCKDTEGSFTCSCFKGFSGDGTYCEDIDECQVENHFCHLNAVCDNTEGFYTCSCMPGYTGDGFSCQNINECQNETHNCHEMAVCKDTLGNFTCECRSGYSGNGTYCEDIDECANSSTCEPHAICLNTNGSYECPCTDGFEKTNGVCSNINECSAGTHDCHLAANCTDLEGSFACSCNIGYQGNGTYCRDINECQALVNPCHVTATCVNRNGSFECNCITEAEENRNDCFNECTLERHDCGNNSLCIDTKTGFNCLCKDGFKGNGYTCVDIDECGGNLHNCTQKFMKCINIPGSFRCGCERLLELKDGNCVERAPDI